MANAGLILAKFCNTMPTELPITRLPVPAFAFRELVETHLQGFWEFYLNRLLHLAR